jgi:hypothetical protein
MTKLPSIPTLLGRKIYKTGQTRGADDDVIYQNRVARNSTVLIPYEFWNNSFKYPERETSFDNGFIVLIPPSLYFGQEHIMQVLEDKQLILGENCLVFYETRQQWDEFNPAKLKWRPAQKRTGTLGGNYVARVPGTTATTGGNKIIQGFTSTDSKGAGIRLYEYSSNNIVKKCRLQLEALFWLCKDSIKIAAQNGMNKKDANTRMRGIIKNCEDEKLLALSDLVNNRVVNKKHRTICPLCLEELSGSGFFNRVAQAEGRAVPDLTVTEINLFHIQELRYGCYNHKPYNVGWGHHH